MKKIGKLGYIAIGSLFTLILGFSFYSFAQTDNQPSSSSSQTTANEFEGNPTAINAQNQTITVFNGSVKKDFTLNPDTITYRNGQKTTLDQIQYTDQVKVTLNSEQVVRYVEATGTKSINSTSTATTPAPNQVPVQVPAKVQSTPSTTPVEQFQLHVDYGNGNHYDMDYYKNKDGKVDSHIQKKAKSQHIEAKDQQAAAYIESLIQQLGLTPNSNQAEILNKVQSVLGVKEYKKLDFKVKFSGDGEIHLNLDSKESKEHGHDHEDEDED